MIFIVVGIMLVVALRIDGGLRDVVDDESRTDTLTNSTTNVNITQVASTTYPSGINNIVGRRSCALTVDTVTPFNTSTSANIIHSGNYTVTGCYLTFASASKVDGDRYNQTLWNVTGSFSSKTDTTQYNSSSNVMESKSNISENQGLLGTIIIFSVIISLVVVAFYFKGGF